MSIHQNHTESELEEFKIIYLRKRNLQFIASIPLIIALLGLLLKGTTELVELPKDIVFPILSGAILLFFIFSIINWRCPACNCYFGQRLNPKNCPKFNISLRD
jgi:hypothetical protein